MGNPNGIQLRGLLAALLSGLLVVPSSLSAVRSAAVVGPSKDATSQGAQLIPGANIFSGDTVNVAQGGDAVLLLGHNATAHLIGDGSVRVFGCEARTVLQVLGGRVVFRSTPKQPVEVEVGDATALPAAGQEVVGLVAFSSKDTINVGAQKGSLTLAAAHQGRRQVVSEGQVYEARLVAAASGAVQPPLPCSDDPPQAPPGQSPPPKRRNRDPIVWVMIGSASTALAVGLLLRGNQTQLSCAQKGALVSPYTFPCP
jgi:hypothetical protein